MSLGHAMGFWGNCSSRGSELFSDCVFIRILMMNNDIRSKQSIHQQLIFPVDEFNKFGSSVVRRLS